VDRYKPAASSHVGIPRKAGYDSDLDESVPIDAPGKQHAFRYLVASFLASDKRKGYRELDGIQSSGTLTRRTTSSTIMNPRFR
jgi:hypothetical protein